MTLSSLKEKIDGNINFDEIVLVRVALKPGFDILLCGSVVVKTRMTVDYEIRLIQDKFTKTRQHNGYCFF